MSEKIYTVETLCTDGGVYINVAQLIAVLRRVKGPTINKDPLIDQLLRAMSKRR